MVRHGNASLLVIMLLLAMVFVVATPVGVGAVSASDRHGGDWYGDGLHPLLKTVDRTVELNIYGPAGLVATGSAGEPRYLLVDHLGSTRSVLGGNNGPGVHHEYAPFGAASLAGGTNVRYAGHPYDPSRGLYETPSRAYDPTAGRFLSVDMERETASPYVYVANDPVEYRDPTGAGRVGTTVTPLVRGLGEMLADKISTFKSSSKFMHEDMEPEVGRFFAHLAAVRNVDITAYAGFKGLVDVAADDHALKEAFELLHAEQPTIPVAKMRDRHLIMSNLDKFDDLMLRRDEYQQVKSRGIAEFGGDREAYYRSALSWMVMSDSDMSAPSSRNGFANCGEAAMCIGGRIAEIDSKVNVEKFSSNTEIELMFLVVGRDPKTDPTKPLTWNDSALIVDGWLGKVNPAKQFYTQGEYSKYYNPEVPIKLEFAFK